MFDPKELSGLARTARLVIGEGGLDLPNILFVDGFEPYSQEDIILDTKGSAPAGDSVLWEGNPLVGPPLAKGGPHLFSIPAHIPYPPSVNEEKGSHFLKDQIAEGQDLFILLNGVDLFKNPKRFADILAALHEEKRPQDIIYAPGLGEPAHLAVLAYLGIDLFDSQPVVKAALAGRRRVIGSPGSIDDDSEIERVLAHNYTLVRTELTTIKEAVRTKETRNLAEERANADINMMALMRIFDEKYYGLLERDLSTTGKGTYRCISRESLNRPAVRRWHKRLGERYERPASASILLLLPCSAKKPYSFSRSHKMFRNAQEGLDNLSAVHEVVITSPLGVVPKELEMFHPANSYDIPVIGVWDSNEQEMIRSALAGFLDNNSYDKCICHFPDRELVEPVLSRYFDKVVFTTEDHRPTSDVSLWNLARALEDALEEAPQASRVQRKQEDMLNRFWFQFTKKFTQGLGEFRVTGRYPNFKALTDQGQIGMCVMQRGGISLTLEGASLLAKSGLYTVTIDDFVPKGTVFAVGVLDATDDIRPGDEVVMVHDGEVRGSGTAQMSGRQMRLLDRGPAISVRHYRK